MVRKAIGIDLGGTFIKVGAVDESGKVLSRVKVATGVPEGRKAVIGRIASAADQARKDAGLRWRDVKAVGLGSPGVCDVSKGVVYHCNNLKCLDGRPLMSPVQRALGRTEIPTILENDANAAAYGEAWVGAGRDVSTLVLFTLGTGIGGGIVLNGDIWRGAWGVAGELGHQTLFPDGARCTCGNRGCLEAYTSAPSLVRRFVEKVTAGGRGRLAADSRAGKKVTARDIAMAARGGDRLCLSLMKETGRFLGIGVANMLHVLNVERVAFAGGMTAAGMLLLKPIREEAGRRTFPLVFRGVKIVFSRMGNDAGLIGAAGWALKRFSEGRRGR